MCGFSARTVAALDALGKQYAAVDVLPDPRIRQELSSISNWPTIPQLFVKGELVGGCDIVTEMYESGELAQTLGVAAAGRGARAGAGGRRARRAAADAGEPARLASGSSRPRARPGRARALPGAARPLPESPGSGRWAVLRPHRQRCVDRQGPGRARSAGPPGAMGWASASVPRAAAVRAAASIRGASSVAILAPVRKLFAIGHMLSQRSRRLNTASAAAPTRPEIRERPQPQQRARGLRAAERAERRSPAA